MASMSNEGTQRILVIRAGQLGDTVFASSVVEPLRDAFGEGVSIHWVAKRGMEGLFAADPRVQHVWGVAHRNLPILLNRDMLAVVRGSWRQPYDLLLNLELGNQFLGLTRLVKARCKLGRPYHLVADDRPEEHAVEHVRRLCALAVPAETAHRGQPSVRGADVDATRRDLGLPDDYVVLNPTNSHFLKSDYRTYRAWPVESWRTLLADLAAERTVVLIGGRAEEAYFKLLEPLPDGVVNLAGRTTLPQLLAAIEGAQALVTTDTGPSHLAAALGTPTVAIFGPSDHRKTGPFATADNVVRIVRAGLPCSPCVFTGELQTCPDNRCMKLITPQQVLDELAVLC